jgi:hypothetical protein
MLAPIPQEAQIRVEDPQGIADLRYNGYGIPFYGAPSMWRMATRYFSRVGCRARSEMPRARYPN